MHASSSRLFELGAGALCTALALLIASRSAPLDTPALNAPEQTPAPDAPPPVLGPSWDSDTAMPKRADEIASYRLSARLDAERHVVSGKGTIRWRNASNAPASELYFHLYLNAFKNDRTRFLRSPFGGGRSGERTLDWGHIDVHKLVARELGNKDLWKSADRHTPGDPDDQTDIFVPLPEPVAPGDVLTLEIEFSAKLPSILERTGYAGSFHFVAQWFPKLARREPDGTWVHFPFEAQSEFYADYGSYDVTIDVPDSMQVGATGALSEEKLENGRRIVRHTAENVHDFAWTAWDAFRERRQQIDGVSVRLLYPPGHDRNADAQLEALAFALPRMNRRFGRYPHPTLTVVHPPRSAQNAGGMEYPTLITTGGAWYASRSGIRSVESVTVHELVHQWFQGLVGTNEHAWPFLDEGLTSFVESRLLEEAYGPGSIANLLGLSVSERSVHRAVAAEYGHDDVVARPAAAFSGFRSLAALVYSRTATILDTLGGVYGHAALERALGRYARRYRFGHPEPRHLIAAVRELLGEQAAQNLELALFERGFVDYTASGILSSPVREPSGVFDRASGRETRDPADASTSYSSRVLIHRHGSLRFPVDVELVFEDGSRARQHWDGRGNWTAITHTGPSRLVAAVVDPDRKLSLDDNLLNNATRLETSSGRVWERATYTAQAVLTGVLP